MATVTAVADRDVIVERDDASLERATMRRVNARLLPFLFLLFVVNYIDRTNIGIAALQMNQDLHFSASAYGLGAGIFFVGYAVFEVPSNLILARVGARRWIARIGITWGLIASAMMFVQTPLQFYVTRFLLGVAEAGFYPGIVYYMSHWYPVGHRGRALSRFIMAGPLAAVAGNPLSAWLLGFDGVLGLRGWQWVFLIEGVPSVLLGFVTLAYLTERPEQARWLSSTERGWLAARLQRESDESSAPHGVSVLQALAHPLVWLASGLYFLTMMGFWGYMFWAPIIIRDTLQVSAVITGFITATIALVAVAAMLIVGATSDRTGDRCLHMAGGTSLMCVGYAVAALAPAGVWRVVGLALVLIGLECYVVPFWCLPTMLLRGSAAAAAIATVNSVGNLGGLVANYLIGKLQDLTGSTTIPFLALSAVVLGAVVLCLMLRRQPAFVAAA